MASGAKGAASVSTPASRSGLPSAVSAASSPHRPAPCTRSALLPVGCLPAVRVPTPDILAATPHPPSTHPDPEHGHAGHPPVAHPHHYQSQAPPYSRGALTMGVGDQMLAPGMLPTMYPPLPGHHHPPGIPVAGRGPVTTDLALAGYHHMHSTDPTLAVSRLDALPDIVHSHNVGHALQPRPNQHRSGTTAAAAASRHQRQRQQQARHGRSRGGTGRDGTGRSGQSRRRSRNHSATSTPTDSGRCKEPCVKCMVTVTSLRCVLLVLSMLGVLFVVSGIVMAALHAVGNDFLIYALVFIGLGVVLVAVVVVAWKCTPPGSEPIHALFNIGDSRSSRRERRPRRTHRPRDGQWHGGMMYPEFQYRRPPPSYAASMQAYQAQIAEAQSNNNTATQANNNSDGYSLPGSPPPSYRSRASTIHSGVHITFPPAHDSAPNSRPPTYRSRADSHHRPRLPLEELEAASPSTAPGDVSFTGPVMTADTVQQIIGTGHRHRRQRSAGALVEQRQSSSRDLAQTADVPHHRRGASLDRTSVNLSSGLTSEENQTSSQQGGGTVSSEAASAGNASLLYTAASSQPSTKVHSKQDAQTASGQTLPDHIRGVGSDSRNRDRESGGADGGDGDSKDTAVRGDHDSEPEQYNTAL